MYSSISLMLMANGEHQAQPSGRRPDALALQLVLVSVLVLVHDQPSDQSNECSDRKEWDANP